MPTFRKPAMRDWYSLETSIVEGLVEKFHSQNGFCIWPRVSVVCCDFPNGYASVSRDSPSPTSLPKYLVVIPVWSLYRLPSYANAYQYLCHEFTHLIVGIDKHHNSEFYSVYKVICPPELWHLDSHYKPRNTRAAGISNKSEVNILNSKLDSGTLSADDL